MLTHLEYHNGHFKMNARLAAVPLHLNDDPSFLEDTGKAPNPITVSLVLGMSGPRWSSPDASFNPEAQALVLSL
jgi:hypothetical protein